jgi:hypothetical protein
MSPLGSLGAPLGHMEWGVRSLGTLRYSWRRALETGHSYLWALCEGNREGGSFSEDPEGYVEKALETRISFHRGPTGEPGRRLIYRGL